MKRIFHTRERQRGAVILMLCHFLLLAALAFSMATHSGVVRQYQSIQNEITYRKHFWLAESGLECAIAVFSSQFENEPDKLSCALSEKLVVHWQARDEQSYQVTSSVGNLLLTQNLQVTNQPDFSVSWFKGSWRDYDE